MPSAEPEIPSNVTEKRQVVKKKARPSANSTRNNTPNAYSRRSPPREQDRKREREPNDETGDQSPPRKLKRPGAGARAAVAGREVVEAARRRREEDEKEAIRERQANADLVSAHYNAVPERGREWRRTDSQIKGLRSLNNWVKSTLIQKFSRPELPVEHLTVLDMACGKGGDLGKWEKAPQVPALYVGCDRADVSIEQARERWTDTQRRSHGRNRRQMDAHFYVKDTFGESLADVPILRQVGFNPNVGPGPGVIQGGMLRGGFDVVSMMFALHYSFKSEALARGMLKNVSGALKKGGRFIGVMPDSDVISATLKRMLQREAKGRTPNGKALHTPQAGEDGEIVEDEGDSWDPEKPTSPAGGRSAVDDDDWDPEKPSEPGPIATNVTATHVDGAKNEDWDPEKSIEKPSSTALTGEQQVPNSNGAVPNQQAASELDIHQPDLQWGNALYKVRFPRSQPLTQRPLPVDGIFRPPYGWQYTFELEEAVNDLAEYVVPFEGFRALAEEYGLELLYRKGFREVFEEESQDKELGMLAERMGVMSRDRSAGRGGLLVGEEEMEAAGFYHAFCFYRT